MTRMPLTSYMIDLCTQSIAPDILSNLFLDHIVSEEIWLLSSDFNDCRKLFIITATMWGSIH